MIYPFSAIVGQESMKTALLLNAVDPSLGGVLVRGQKGTAKTTAVRSLAQWLPPMPGRKSFPLVELPLGASEDRLVGTLHLEKALQEGVKAFEPGLLAQADGGILYVDEVNLLEDHLVDLLLDVAVSGQNRIERDGISHVHPARFVLVGTMNPEEGELRPQFLDRFGLCVQVSGIAQFEERSLVLRRWLDFEADPEAFCQRFSDQEKKLGDSVSQARMRLAEVGIPETVLEEALRCTARAEVQGHRADIALIKACRALAAWQGEPAITGEHVQKAARLVLPHRLRQNPFDSLDQQGQRMEKVLA